MKNETVNPLSNGTKVTIGGYVDGKERTGKIAGHGYGKKTGTLIYIVDVEKVAGFQGWSGGARPVVTTKRIKASHKYIKAA